MTPARSFIVNARVLTLWPERPVAWGLEVACGRVQRLLAGRGEMDRRSGEPVHDAGGGMVLPSFADAHIHLRSWAILGRGLDLARSRGLDDALERIGRAAAKLPSGKWLVAHGWNRNGWRETGWPGREDLDSVCGERPAVVYTHDLHGCWASSAALAACGLSGDLSRRLEELPRGVRTSARGKVRAATGALVEEAVGFLARSIPVLGPREQERLIRKRCRELYSLGVTAVTDFDGLEAAERYAALYEPLRVRASVLREELPGALARRLHSGYELAGGVVLGPLKLFVDGSLGSRTAWMLEPFETEPRDCGLSLIPQDELEELVTAAIAGRLELAAHAIGDAANRFVLDVISRVPRETRNGRIRIEHAQLLSDSDLARFAPLGVIASVQPAHLRDDIVTADREWGARARGAFPLASLHAHGARMAFGSDAPVASADPLIGLEAAVRREDASGRPRGGWYPGERIDLQTALRCYTQEAQAVCGFEGSAGRLQPGWLADMVCLEGDPAAPRPTDWRVTATWIGGEPVYQMSGRKK